MIDVWEYRREKSEKCWRESPVPLIQAKTDFDSLQLDADALLAVVRAHLEIERGIVDFDLHHDAVVRYRKAIDALPKRLK